MRKIRVNGMDEYSEDDFIRCAKMITPQPLFDEPRRTAPDPRPDERRPDPAAFFHITNLLNHPTTEIIGEGALC
jgi:hypothetical protein